SSCMCAVSFDPSRSSQSYTLSLHDALPILRLRTEPTMTVGISPSAAYWLYHGAPRQSRSISSATRRESVSFQRPERSITLSWVTDRKSTRLNSSHVKISYAVFCLKKKQHLA